MGVLHVCRASFLGAFIVDIVGGGKSLHGICPLPSLRVAIRHSAYLYRTILVALINKYDHAAFKMGGPRVNVPCSVLSTAALSLLRSIKPCGPLV